VVGPKLSDLPERVAAAVSRRVIEVLDVDDIVRRIDVDALAKRIDVDALAQRLDVAALVARIDLNALLAEVDIEALLDRVDVNDLLAEVDLDAALARVDLAPLLLRAGLPDLIAGSTGQVAGSALDVARRQVVGIDKLVSGAVNRLARRDTGSLPVAPGPLGSGVVATALSPRARARARANVTGHYAGPLSRLLGFVLDYAFVLFSFTAFAAVGNYALRVITGFEVTTGQGATGAVLVTGWAFLYWWVSLNVSGRTAGMSILGLRVVRSDGRSISGGWAALRVLLMPVSFAIVGLGLLGVVLDARHRALHDALSRTVVVYDWGDRPAELPSPLSAWLAEREARAS